MLRELTVVPQPIPRCRSATVGCHPHVRRFFLGESNFKARGSSPLPRSSIHWHLEPCLTQSCRCLASRLQAYDTAKLLILAATPNRKGSTLSTSEIAAAGFLSAVPTTLVAAPVERAKVLLQVQGQGKGSTQYKGVFDVLRHLYKEGGIKSVFRGSVATVIRDGPGSAAFVPLPPPLTRFIMRIY